MSVKNKIIFNADDFGMSLGVNAAIEKAYNEGILNAASLMVNQKYAPQALKMAKNMKNLDLGLHVNLTNEYATLLHDQIPLLTDENGKFKNGFVKLLWLSILHPKKMRFEVQSEMEAQIQKARTMGAELEHIDSHRHVHMIPLIFDEMLKLKEKYKIKRIRTINESAILTLCTNNNKSYLKDGGMIKYALLKFFYYLNGYVSKTYFYTMLYTCKLSKEHFQKVLIPKGYDSVEIMIHPSQIDVDQNHQEDIFDRQVLSFWRKKELETLLDKKLPENFVFGAKYPFLFELYFKIEKFWFDKVPEKLRFLLVGGFNTVFAYAVYALLVLFIPYWLALPVQYFITINVSVATMRYYVFRSQGNILKEFAKAWSVYLSLLVFNMVGLWVLIDILEVNKFLAQALYLCFSTILTYLLHKYFSFNKK